MQQSDHIEQLRYIHHFHSIRKIRAEYRMVYARSYIYRMARNHLPDLEEDLQNKNGKINRIIENATKMVLTHAHFRCTNTRPSTANKEKIKQKISSNSMEYRNFCIMNTHCDPSTFGKLVSIGLSHHTNCTSCVHQHFQHSHFHHSHSRMIQIHMDCMVWLVEEDNLHNSIADSVCIQPKNQTDHRKMIRSVFVNCMSNI